MTLNIWTINTEDCVADLESYYWELDEQERARVDSFRFQSDQQRFVISHFALRDILSTCLCVPLKSIQYSYNAFGKPSVYGTRREIHFNLSHSGALAVVAVSHMAPVGIDIEHIVDNDDYLSIAERLFSPLEYREIVGLPKDLGLTLFYEAWVRREAIGKAMGKGLLHKFVDFASSNVLDSSHNKVTGSANSGWILFSLPVPEGYRGAACSLVDLQFPQKVCVSDWFWKTRQIQKIQ